MLHRLSFGITSFLSPHGGADSCCNIRRITLNRRMETAQCILHVSLRGVDRNEKSSLVLGLFIDNALCEQPSLRRLDYLIGELVLAALA